MKKLLFAGLTVAALVLGPAAVLACGDKFVVLGRAGRFFVTKYPATILIYVNPASHMPAAMKDFRLEATLKKAGHKPKTVDSSADLEQALASGKYDLVLADLSDCPDVSRDAASTTGKPMVVPVLYKPTPEELSSVEKKYGCLIAPASSRATDLLPVLEQAMQNRAKGAGTRCRTST
jgi:hypothetical protein